MQLSQEERARVEKKFDELMLGLPVNDYRVYHQDIITSEKRPTLRGSTIKDFLFSTIESILQAKAAQIEEFAKFIAEGGPEGEYYLLPPNAKNVVGYINDPVIGGIAYKGKPMNVRAVIEEAVIKSAAILKGEGKLQD